MLWMMRAVLFLGYLAAACLLVLAASDFTNKRYRRAVGEAVAGILGFGAGIIVMYGATASLTAQMEGDGLAVEDKARLIGSMVSTQMNYAVIGFAIGVCAGAYLALRRKRLEMGTGASS